MPRVIYSLAALTLAAATAPPLYKNAAAPVPARVADLLARMTTEEKTAQLWTRETGSSLKLLTDTCSSTGIGQANVAFADGSTPADYITARNAIQAECLKSRLSIPISFFQEGLHTGGRGGTLFPEPVTTGCTWNVSLVSAIGAALAFEARGAGVDNTWSPVLNMWVDDRFGRQQEGFSPDPMITSTFGRALVVGAQGGVSAQDDYLPGNFSSNTWSTGKHFSGYGSAAGGLNGAPFVLNNRTFFEHFLRPWRAAVAVGLRGAMPSHNMVLETPMHASRWALRGVLRGEFGMGNGALVSDCNDIGALKYFGIAAGDDNHTRVVGYALRAGVDLDLQCGPETGWSYDGLSVADAIAAGYAAQADVDELVTHVLTQKFACTSPPRPDGSSAAQPPIRQLTAFTHPMHCTQTAGLFDAPMTDPSWAARLNAPAHQQLAYEAAAQGLVLLKNNGLLPLAPTTARVALLGPHMVCDPNGGSKCLARDSLLGSYTLDDGSVDVPLIPEGFAAAAPNASVTVAPGCAIDGDPRLDLIPAAVAAARAADVAVLALGDTLQSCGEWADRDSLDLPGGQLALLAAVLATGTPTVVVLVGGRAASFGPANALLQNVSALLLAWRPGQAGARAIADVLVGAVNPSGKLASQWAQHVGQLGSGAQPFLAKRVGKWIANGRSAPDATDGREYDPYVASAFPSTPLFRFGAGLSYTTFEYRSLALSPAPSIASLPGGGVFSGRGRAGYAGAINTPVVTATVMLCNTGSRAGAEAVQVYSQDPAASDFETPLVPYWKRLVGFGKILLAAGACDSLAIPLLADDLALYDPAMNLRIIAGSYAITAGGRSDADTLRATLVMA